MLRGPSGLFVLSAKDFQMFQDYLFFGTDVETRYAFRMIHLSGLVRHAQSLHCLTNPQAELLGQGLMAGVLLASILEDEERINLRFHAGQDCTMGIETTRQAVTRGYLECNESSELVAQLNQGQKPVFPWVVRSLRSKGDSSNLFEGISGTQTDSLEMAVNEHLRDSYQMKTQVKLDCWQSPVDGSLHAMGVIYLELPHLKTEVSHELWNHIDQLPPLRHFVDATQHNPDSIASALIPHQVRAINSLNPVWGCGCSQVSVENVIMKLGQQELKSMIDEAKPAEVRCHYCNKTYVVDLTRMKKMYEELGGLVGSGETSPLN